MKHILFGIIGLIIFSGCNIGSKEEKGPKYGGTLRINASNVPDIIFPGQVLKSSEQLITSQTYVGLLKYHPRTLDIVPSLANNWESSENKTKFTFYLNHEAYFHDDECFENGKGRKIIARDVKYSIEQTFHFHKLSQHEISDQVKNIVGVMSIPEKTLSSKNTNISGIIVPNDSTIVFNLEKADPMFVHFLASTNSLVFPKEAFEKYGFKSTVGSGAYYFSYPKIKGHAITLVSNPTFFGRSKRNEQLPFIDTITVSFITSPPKELLLFERGDLDLVLGISGDYVAGFLEDHIDKFQSNPPYYLMKQTTDDYNNLRYNFVRANVKNLEINSLGYFDLTQVYFEEPVAREVKVLE